MQRSRWPLLSALAFACLLGPGCGDDGASTAEPPSPQVLTSAERARADRSVAAIRAHCRRVALYATGRAGRPGPGSAGRAVAAARELGSVARRKPHAPYRGSQRARDLPADLAEDLEGTNCSARLVAELARGIP